MLQGHEIHLGVRPGKTAEDRFDLLEAWYRSRLKGASLPILAKWEERMGVWVEKLFIRRMKSRWGTCNYRAGTIRLNTNLTRRSAGCLESVIVHDRLHLLEPSHNGRFKTLMGGFLPQWLIFKKELGLLLLLLDNEK